MFQDQVRCKFICQSVTKAQQSIWDPKAQKSHVGFVYSYKFYVVTNDGSSENEMFFASTPTGELTIGALRDDLFEIGHSYYLDLTDATKLNP